MPEIQHEILEKTLEWEKNSIKVKFSEKRFSAINYARSNQFYEVYFLLPMKLNKSIKKNNERLIVNEKSP